MKEIVLPVRELKEALPGLSKITGRTRTLPVLLTVMIARDNKGNVSLTATDLDSSATYRLKETQSGAPITMLAPLDQLIKTVKGLAQEDSLSLAPDTKDKLKLRYPIGGSLVEQSINTLPVNEFPPLPQVSQPAIKLEPEFGAAFKQALECCSQDQSRGSITGVCLDVSDSKGHYIVATNATMLFSANSFNLKLPQSIVIPDSKFLDWTDLMDEASTLSMEPAKKANDITWIKLESPRWTFITKEIAGTYPNWKQIIPTVNGRWTHIQFSQDSIKQLLQVIPRLPGDDTTNHPVRLRITGNYLVVEGRNKDEKEWTSIPVQGVVITGKPVTICFNRNYLIKALEFGLSQLDIEDPLSPAVFSQAGRKLVVMPVKLEEKPDAKPAPAPATEEPTTQAKPEAEATPEERKTEMPRTSTKPKPTETQLSLIDQVETIKETLKNVVRDLNSLVDAVKVQEKEKRATEKEVETVRSTLNKIKQVTI